MTSKNTELIQRFLDSIHSASKIAWNRLESFQSFLDSIHSSSKIALNRFIVLVYQVNLHANPTSLFCTIKLIQAFIDAIQTLF